MVFGTDGVWYRWCLVQVVSGTGGEWCVVDVVSGRCCEWQMW